MSTKCRRCVWKHHGSSFGLKKVHLCVWGVHVQYVNYDRGPEKFGRMLREVGVWMYTPTTRYRKQLVGASVFS